MNHNTKQRIGFVGVGMMGHGMVKNLLLKGYEVTFKTGPSRAKLDDILAAGGREVSTYAELVAASDIILLSVTGTPQVEDVVYSKGGLLEATREGLYVIDTSTSEPTSTTRIRADFFASGTTFIDAPMARSPKEAEEGRLNTMVGAEMADFELIKPILQCFCENIFHCGLPGHGHVLKLVMNFITMGMSATIAEAFATAAKSGLSLTKLHEVVSAGGANSPIFQFIIGGMLKGDLEGLKFGISSAQKDLRYYTHMTESLDIPSFIGEAVHQSFVQASALGFGGKFVPSLLEVQEKINNVKIIPR